MAYTNTDTNMTTSSALSAGMQTYYNRELLRTFEPNLVHLQFGDEHRMPPHSGLVMNMRKLIPLETNTKALSEGDPGESVMLAETEVTVQLQQYGEYARCTDKLDLTHLDMDIMRRTKLFGDAGARSIDAVVREELAKCANVIYAGGKASRAELTAADKLTILEQDAGLHFLLKVETALDDRALTALFAQSGLHVQPLSSFHTHPTEDCRGMLVINYSAVDERALEEGLGKLEI